MSNATPASAAIAHPGFAAGTLVHTLDGLRKIEDIRTGDKVLTFPAGELPPNHRRLESEYVYGEVINTLARADQSVLHVTVSDLAAGVREVIAFLPEQRVFAKGQGWIPASSLRFGHTFENAVFGNLLVSKVQVGAARANMHGIEVAKFFTSYVGTTGVWVLT
ncbi:MAG: polymorphic toxin-type HINT domain-containing protein [Moraxellaceae bacterium]|nr:polymorphic toxin-type HINT domain-containing protein [Moraxellaceae bacterium]